MYIHTKTLRITAGRGLESLALVRAYSSLPVSVVDIFSNLLSLFLIHQVSIGSISLRGWVTNTFKIIKNRYPKLL